MAGECDASKRMLLLPLFDGLTPLEDFKRFDVSKILSQQNPEEATHLSGLKKVRHVATAIAAITALRHHGNDGGVSISDTDSQRLQLRGSENGDSDSPNSSRVSGARYRAASTTSDRTSEAMVFRSDGRIRTLIESNQTMFNATIRRLSVQLTVGGGGALAAHSFAVPAKEINGVRSGWLRRHHLAVALGNTLTSLFDSVLGLI